MKILILNLVSKRQVYFKSPTSDFTETQECPQLLLIFFLPISTMTKNTSALQTV